MSSNVGFVSKVLITSAGVAIAIKYGGSYLNIAPTSVNAMVAVLVPTLIMAGLLGWRAQQAAHRAD
jgi:hypothetical protein